MSLVHFSICRSNLLNDAFSLAESGHLPYSIPLSMTRYLRKESALIPWESAYAKLINLKTLLFSTSTYPLLRKYMVSLVKDNYNRLEWRDDGSHTDRLNRIDILSLACSNGYKPCLDQAGDLFLAWIKDKSAYIPPNLRSIAYQ